MQLCTLPYELIEVIVRLAAARDIAAISLINHQLCSICNEYMQSREYWHRLSQQSRVPILTTRFWQQRFHMTFSRIIMWQSRINGMPIDPLPLRDKYAIKYNVAKTIKNMIEEEFMGRRNAIKAIMNIYTNEKTMPTPKCTCATNARLIWINNVPYAMTPRHILDFLVHAYCVDQVMFLYDFAGVNYSVRELINQNSNDTYGCEIQKITNIIAAMFNK